MNNFEYTIYADDKLTKVDLDEYQNNEDLIALINDASRMRLILGRTVLTYSHEYLAENPEDAQQLVTLEQIQLRNPLRFYAPNSKEQEDFINDDDASVCAMVDLNRIGKTTAAYIKMLVGESPMIQCDPEWEIFKHHGIKFREFRGPISCGIATYNQAKLDDPIWSEMVKKWTPDDELGIYGRTYRGKGGKSHPSWGHDKNIKSKKSKSILGFYTYEMDQGNYEGGALNKWLWDEQGTESKFDGADRGTRTTKGKHIFSLTPHKVEGRPDTGGGGWMKPFLTGKVTKDHTVGVYHAGDIWDAPDWIYPISEKKKEIIKWETEPLENDDRKRIAEGRARLYGEWHTTAGLVLDEWNPAVHWIEPLWEFPPDNLTLYRAIDHGTNNPTACIWFAVDPNLNIFIYRCMYTRGRTVNENVAEIIKLSGNKREPLDNYHDERSGMNFVRYREITQREYVWKTAMDSRSFSTNTGVNQVPLGQIYKWAGLDRLTKAQGKFTDHWVPMINQLLLPDPTHKHPVTGELGAPHLYIFNVPENRPMYREIEGWVYEEQKGNTEHKNATEKPRDKDNHLMTAMGYGVMIPLRFVGNLGKRGGKEIRPNPKNFHEARDIPMQRKRATSPKMGYRSY